MYAAQIFSYFQQIFWEKKKKVKLPPVAIPPLRYEDTHKKKPL